MSLINKYRNSIQCPLLASEVVLGAYKEFGEFKGVDCVRRIDELKGIDGFRGVGEFKGINGFRRVD